MTDHHRKEPRLKMNTLGRGLQVSRHRLEHTTQKKVDPELLDRTFRKVRLELIQERGQRCEACRVDLRGQRIYCDHIIERSDGGDLIDRSNLMLMCASCHGLKTAAARGERARRDYSSPSPDPGQGPRPSGSAPGPDSDDDGDPDAGRYTIA